MIEENLQNGYVKIYRSMLNWEWFKDINTTHLFIYCLIKANFQEKNYQGIKINRGQFMTSYDKMCAETGLSKSKIRTAIKHLILTQELTQTSHKQYSIITVNNYNDYQKDNINFSTPLTYQSHTFDTPLTSTNNEKNDNKEKNEKNTYLYNEKTKIDPYINPIKNYFIQEYQKIFNNKARLSNQMCNRLIELNSEIEDFKETIPIVLRKFKEIKFKYADNTTHKASLSWLLQNDNYFKVLDGQFDKQKNDMEEFYSEMNKRNNKKQCESLEEELPPYCPN